MCYSVVVSRYILYTLFTLWLTCEGDITLNLEFSFWKLPFLFVSAFKGVNFLKHLFTPPLGGILGPFREPPWLEGFAVEGAVGEEGAVGGRRVAITSLY